MRGFCSKCKDLVEIRPGRKHDAGSSRDWIPLPHPGPNGAPCDGVKLPAGDVEFGVPKRGAS